MHAVGFVRDGLPSCAGVAVFGADGTTIEYPCATNASGGESPTSCYCRVGCGIQEYMSNIYCEDRPDGLTECDLNGDHVAEGYNYYGTCVEPKAACGTSCSTNQNCEQATLGTNMGETSLSPDVNNVFAVGEALSYDEADGDADIRTLESVRVRWGEILSTAAVVSATHESIFRAFKGRRTRAPCVTTRLRWEQTPRMMFNAYRSFYPTVIPPATAVTARGTDVSHERQRRGDEDYQMDPTSVKIHASHATSSVAASASDAPSAGQSQCLWAGVPANAAGSRAAPRRIARPAGAAAAPVCSPNVPATREAVRVQQ